MSGDVSKVSSSPNYETFLVEPAQSDSTQQKTETVSLAALPFCCAVHAGLTCVSCVGCGIWNAGLFGLIYCFCPPATPTVPLVVAGTSTCICCVAANSSMYPCCRECVDNQNFMD